MACFGGSFMGRTAFAWLCAGLAFFTRLSLPRHRSRRLHGGGSRRWPSMRRSMTVGVASFFSLGVLLAAEYPGAIPGGFSVSDQGAGQYSIPIAAPAATGGLKPNLALTYNHLAGNGLAGMRWTLSGFSSITRCHMTYAQDGETEAINYGSDDRFCLDGQRLVVTSGSYGASGSIYSTEIESFQRIKSLGTAGSGPQYFTVEHGNGSISYYGYSGDSRIEKVGASDVRLWYISFTEDQFGNRINYGYDENATTGEVVPDEVTWTTNSGLSAKYKIEITYETRPTDDQRSGHEPGAAAFARTKRISYIRVFHTPGSTYEISEYALTYNSSSNTGRSQLKEVTLQGQNTDTLPETVFTVQNGTKSWNSLASTGESAGGYGLVGDFNNDGHMDVFDYVGGAWKVYRGRSDGDFESAISSGEATSYPSLARAIDYNGDGYTDLMYVDGADTWYIRLSSGGTSFGSAFSTGLTTSIYSGGIGTNPYIQDFDGDGLSDIVYTRDSNIQWRRNTGSGFASEEALYSLGAAGEFPQWNRQLAPDFNGDSRADVLAILVACYPQFNYCIQGVTSLVASGNVHRQRPAQCSSGRRPHPRRERRWPGRLPAGLGRGRIPLVSLYQRGGRLLQPDQHRDYVDGLCRQLYRRL